jgi:nucleotide-binding universal stress UspA family protein
MLKRILVLLGETSSSVCARRYALRLAAIKGASLVGLAGVDRSFIEETIIGGIGTASLQAGIERELVKDAEEARHRLHDAFETECNASGIDLECLTFDSDPIETLCLASETCDLVVTGHDTGFRGTLREQLSETLSKLLRLTPRPVVVCPDQLLADEEVLIAYDGSVPAARAVQTFALLGIAASARILVTSVESSPEAAAHKIDGTVSYLRMHDYDVEAYPVASTSDPAVVLSKIVGDRHSGTLVMGAYGHRGLRELFFGSTTSTLVEAPPCPIFLYH